MVGLYCWRMLPFNTLAMAVFSGAGAMVAGSPLPEWFEIFTTDRNTLDAIKDKISQMKVKAKKHG